MTDPKHRHDPHANDEPTADPASTATTPQEEPEDWGAEPTAAEARDAHEGEGAPE